MTEAQMREKFERLMPYPMHRGPDGTYMSGDTKAAWGAFMLLHELYLVEQAANKPSVDPILAECQALAAEGKRASALAMYRTRKGVSLAEARDVLYPDEVKPQAGQPDYWLASYVTSGGKRYDAAVRDLQKAKDMMVVGHKPKPLYHEPPRVAPLTVDDLWCSDPVMTINAELQLSVDTWARIAKAIEATQAKKATL